MFHPPLVKHSHYLTIFWGLKLTSDRDISSITVVGMLLLSRVLLWF